MRLTEIDINNVNDKIIKDVLFTTSRVNYDEADVLIVFGCHIKSLLDERINEAYKIIKEKKFNKIILTGGVGVNGDFNEAEYMKDSLVSMGILPDRLILEDKSTTTEENVLNTIELLKRNDLLTNKRITLLSHEPHLRRIRMEFSHQLKNSNNEYIYEYPQNMITYEKVINNGKFRNVAVQEIRKIIRFINDGILDDEEVSVENNTFSEGK